MNNISLTKTALSAKITALSTESQQATSVAFFIPKKRRIKMVQVNIESNANLLSDYAKKHNLSLDKAAEQLIGEGYLEYYDSAENENNHDMLSRVIRGNIKSLNVKQLRLICELTFQLQGK
ncbi:hypothetical protein P2G70_12700 [Mannheimia haemolytica]|nr:hypothetical protein [Mannheimia haemolytica]